VIVANSNFLIPISLQTFAISSNISQIEKYKLYIGLHCKVKGIKKLEFVAKNPILWSFNQKKLLGKERNSFLDVENQECIRNRLSKFRTVVSTLNKPFVSL